MTGYLRGVVTVYTERMAFTPEPLQPCGCRANVTLVKDHEGDHHKWVYSRQHGWHSPRADHRADHRAEVVTATETDTEQLATISYLPTHSRALTGAVS